MKKASLKYMDPHALMEMIEEALGRVPGNFSKQPTHQHSLTKPKIRFQSDASYSLVPQPENPSEAGGSQTANREKMIDRIFASITRSPSIVGKHGKRK